jgi:hypothetical protein
VSVIPLVSFGIQWNPTVEGNCSSGLFARMIRDLGMIKERSSVMLLERSHYSAALAAS